MQLTTPYFKKTPLPVVIFLIITITAIGWADTRNQTGPNIDQLKSVKAEFRQEKHLKILVKPIISKGVFIFQAPSSLRWEYTSPIKSIMLQHKSRSKKFIQKNGELVEEHAVNFEFMQVILREITNWLNGRFTDNPIFIASFEKDQRIIFTPKEKNVSKFIKTIELKLSNEPSLINSITIYEGPHSFTRLTFNNAKINQEIPSSLFTEK